VRIEACHQRDSEDSTVPTRGLGHALPVGRRDRQRFLAEDVDPHLEQLQRDGGMESRRHRHDGSIDLAREVGDRVGDLCLQSKLAPHQRRALAVPIAKHRDNDARVGGDDGKMRLTDDGTTTDDAEAYRGGCH
jgi:hypothetical protein